MKAGIRLSLLILALTAGSALAAGPYQSPMKQAPMMQGPMQAPSKGMAMHNDYMTGAYGGYSSYGGAGYYSDCGPSYQPAGHHCGGRRHGCHRRGHHARRHRCHRRGGCC
jgi:hypothetical protein